MNLRLAFLATCLVGLLSAPLSAQADAPAAQEAQGAAPKVQAARIVARYPHDATAFTQGLLWHDGSLFESTGRERQSGIREIELETGKIIRQQAIPADQFGEGLALWDDALISLTWRDGVVHRWNAQTLESVSSDSDFPFEGWGLTTLPEGLVLSDGSDTLRILDPADFSVKREIAVTLNGRPLPRLNELEAVDGLVFANIWHSPFIVVIDPADGVVRTVIDLRDIVAGVAVDDPEAVLNGIAWNADQRRLFVTGKLWPNVFEIALAETDQVVD